MVGYRGGKIIDPIMAFMSDQRGTNGRIMNDE